MVFMTRRMLACALLLSAGIVAQQRYDGPPPPKKDLPYLVQAGSLVETEQGTAQPREDANQTTYIVPGANSPVKTTAAIPAIVIDVSKIDLQSLQFFRLESRDGHREIVFPKRAKPPRPVPMVTTRLGGSLFKLEAADDLPKGEYSLTPQGSNAVFCFAVD
jgi:hypothetical protein